MIMIRYHASASGVLFCGTGNLSGDSVGAYWNAQDFTLLMLQGCLHTATAPTLQWDVEFTPVDFVSNLVVKLTQQMTLGLGKIFHVINTEPIKSQYVHMVFVYI